MVKVDQIVIICEDMKDIIYIYTPCGFIDRYIPSFYSCKLNYILNHQSKNSSLYRSLLSESSIKVDKCVIQKDQDELRAVLLLSDTEKSISGFWLDGIITALELDVPIFIEQNLLVCDYIANNDEHELLVKELIELEEKSEQSKEIKAVMQEMLQAVTEERYEDAAKLRDKLSQLRKSDS